MKCFSFLIPRNVWKIENASGIGEVGNLVCVYIMKMFIKVKDNVITDVKFKTFGCGVAIATSSISTEMIIGKTLEGSLLAEEAIHLAIADYYRKEGKMTEEEIKKKCNLKEHSASCHLHN